MPALPTLGLAIALGAAPAAAPAQPAAISNTTLRPVATDSGLADALDGLVRGATGPRWLGWSVPSTDGADLCCHRESGRRCRLEGDDGMSFGGHRESRPEPSGNLVVLVRAESGSVRRVWPLSEGCALDGGGATLHWIAGVDPDESVAVLERLVAGDAEPSSRKVLHGALAAIAHHRARAADVALRGLVEPGQPRRTREQAAFWMGSARAGTSLTVLLRMAREDGDARFREHLAFVLTQADDPRATDGIVAMARGDASRKVRGQALFWLGQQAGRKAVAALEEALEDDPDTEIQKRAVFALSQLPRDEGVPILIRTARSHSKRAVRKQAFFWLGQSGDPRALAFFEEVLSR